MSLDLAKLLPQVDQLGGETAKRQAERAALLPQAQHALRQSAGLDRERVLERIQQAGDRWRGASPTSERWDLSHAPPSLPQRWHAIGADGSQVYPDRHAAAQYFLVNVGSLRLTHGSGGPPSASSRPALFYRQVDLTTQQGESIDSGLVNGMRDLAEMAELAELAEQNRPEPTVTLLDNGLLLWIALQEMGLRRREIDELLRRYFDELGRLQKADAALAGFIDRPGGTNLLRLVELCLLAEGVVSAEAAKLRRFPGLVDSDLMHGLLPAGHRSALFSVVSPLNTDFERRGHGVFFFYLNTGYEDQIARVEIPAWVAADPRRLGWIHSGLLQECQVTGIPYVLVRAHELAVVTQEDRQALESLIAGALLREGISPRTSQKSTTKRWTAQRRRHRL